MIADLIIGEHIRRTHFRLGNINDYGAYIKATSMDKDSEDSNFAVVTFRMDTPLFIKNN